MRWLPDMVIEFAIHGEVVWKHLIDRTSSGTLYLAPSTALFARKIILLNGKIVAPVEFDRAQILALETVETGTDLFIRIKTPG